MSQSGYERNLVFQIAAVKLPAPECQYRFAKPRRWTFDLAWPHLLLYAEVEGGIWIRGRHTRGKGYEKDCEKYNEAALSGWRGLRFTTGHVKDGTALRVLERALGASTRLEKACDRVVMRSADDSAAYLSVPCTCGKCPGWLAGGIPRP